MFNATFEWLEQWPGILATLDGLVAFGDEEGWIGRGVFVEVTDALRRGLPVWYLPASGPPRETFALSPAPLPVRSFQRFARLVPLEEAEAA